MLFLLISLRKDKINQMIIIIIIVIILAKENYIYKIHIVSTVKIKNFRHRNRRQNVDRNMYIFYKTFWKHIIYIKNPLTSRGELALST